MCSKADTVAFTNPPFFWTPCMYVFAHTKLRKDVDLSPLALKCLRYKA